MSAVMPPDLELWACDWIRDHIRDVPGLTVGNRIPDAYDGSHPLVSVRDDGGGQSERILFDRSLGVNVLGWTRSDNGPCKDLARRIYALLTDPDDITRPVGSPIVAVVEDGCNGPYPVTDDLDVAHYYLTVEYSAVGAIIQ